MNRGPSEERISAYFDREIPPEDRVLLEKEVVNDSALEQDLAEIRLLSSVIKDQPTYPAPDDLLTSVMSAIENDSSNGDVIPATDNHFSRPQISRGISPRLFAASLVTTAAVMLLISQWALLSQSNSHKLAMRDQETKLTDSLLNEERARNKADEVNSLYAALRRKGSNNSALTQQALKSYNTYSTDYARRRAFDYKHIVPSPILVAYDNDSFRKATPQEFFDAVLKKWSHVNLIQLSVSDIDRGQEYFQKILAAEIGIDKTWGENYNTTQMEPIVKQGGYKALFVQATHPQMMRIFETLQHVEHDNEFEAITIHHAIPQTGLDYESQHRILNPMTGPKMPVVLFRNLRKDDEQTQFLKQSRRSDLDFYAVQMQLHVPRELLDLETPAPKRNKQLVKKEKSSKKSKDGYVRRKKDGRYIWFPRPIKTIFILTEAAPRN